MAKMIPSKISYETKSAAEKRFFSLMESAPNTEDWIVLHSVNIARHVTQTQGESDFIVIIPQQGVFVVEVKGGRIHYEDGCWTSVDRNNKVNPISSPINEASTAMHSLKKYIESQLPSLHTNLKHCLWGYCIAFPDSYFDNNYTLPDLANEQIADSSSMNDLTGFFLKLSNFWKTRVNIANLKPIYPNKEECKIISNILRPNIDFSVSLTGQVETVEKQIISLTDNQNTILEGLMENERCLIRGGAGTGKTLLALNFYKAASFQGGNIAFFCYNKQLASYIQNSIQTPYTCCFHGYMESVAKSVFPQEIAQAKENQKQYYEIDLPNLFMDAFIQNNCELFDYLILDEAQDLMSTKYLEVFDLILSGGLQHGKWLFFMDADHQNLYSQNSYQGIQSLLAKYDTYYTKYLLKDNCRNSVAIIEMIDKWFGFNTRHRNVQEKGVEVVTKPYRHEEQEQEELQSTLYELLKKFSPSDIVLLSPKRFENSIASQTKVPLISEKKQSGSIYFSTIQAFKGLESKIVILCDISDIDTPQAKQHLYVGMTRAKSALYIILLKRVLAQLAKEQK